MKARIKGCWSVIFLCIGISVLACKKAELPSGIEPVQVKAAIVAEAEEPDILSAFGSLAWEKKVEIKSPQDAQVIKLYFREGDVVIPGQIMAQLFNPQVTIAVDRAENGLERANAALLVAEARVREGILSAESRLLTLEKAGLELKQAERELAEAERKHADQEQLFTAGGITEEAIRGSRFSLESTRERIVLMRKDLEIRSIGTRPVDLLNAGMPVPSDPDGFRNAIIHLNTETLRAERDAAQAGLSTAQGELDSARLVDAELQIRAPSGGTIGARHAEEGERIKREDPLFTLIDMTVLHAVVPVNESEAVRINIGMDASVVIDSLNRTVNGKVELIAPVADSRTASFSVRINLLGRLTGIKPGMFAKCEITLGPSRKVLVVPESALFNRSGKNASLFAVVAGKAQVRSVEIESSSSSTAGTGKETLIIISAGVRSGEVVILNPQSGLREGDNVKVKQ